MKRYTPIFIILIIIPFCLFGNDRGLIKNYFQISKSEGLSNNNVTTICDDNYGRIWIGTHSGLNIYDSKKLTTPDIFRGIFISKLFNTGEEILIGSSQCLMSYNYTTGIYKELKDGQYDIKYVSSIFYYEGIIRIVAGNNIYSYEDYKIKLIKQNLPCNNIVVDKFGTLWGMEDNIVYQIGADYTVAKEYKLLNSSSSLVNSLCIFPDSSGSIWIGSEKDGLYRYNRATDSFSKENLEKTFGIKEIENIGSISEDQYLRLWIGHNSGITVYDYNNNHLKDYMIENSYGITENTTVTNIYKTKGQYMVIGTYFTGFFFINELNSAFSFYNFSQNSKEDGGIAINGIIKDEANRLWITTNRTGINIVNEQGQIKQRLNQSNSKINNNIVSIAEDNSGNIWAGSLSNGLYKIENTQHITHYFSASNLSSSISGNTIYGLYPLNQDSLIIATNKGIDVYLQHSNSFSNIITTQNDHYAFYNIHAYQNYIYAVNLTSIITYDRSSKKTSEYKLNDRYPNILVQSSYATNNGSLLLGTNRGNILHFEDNTIKSYLTDDQIQSGISGIQADKNGNIWIASGNDIFCINPKKELRKINLRWGLGKNEFNVRSSFSDEDGYIYFGTTDGYVKFNPQKVIDNVNEKPRLFISDFKLFGKSVAANDNNEILKEHINNTKKIELKNNQNFISFDISSIDFGANQIPYSFRYRLNNFDENWNEISIPPYEISYTGLPTGQYTLDVQLVANDGQIIDAKNIDIKVNAPFYLSSYMILLYISLICSVIYLIIRQIKKQRTAKELINRAKREQEEAEKLNSLKLDFFTYISHEFKTPLSIISTLQEDILPDNVGDNIEVEIFRRNVKRLEYLIGQLMEFRGIESQHSPIKYSKQNILAFIQEITEAFYPLCKRKEIDFQFITDTDEMEMLIDSAKLEMLIGNLLSNSIKHTNMQGCGYIKIRKENNVLIIDVFNSGRCLTEEEKQTVFEPYNRTESSDIYTNSGIGLAIVNSIAKYMNIDLSIITVEGEGNIFRFEIPILQEGDAPISTSDTKTNIVKEIVDNTIYIEEQSLSNTDQSKSLHGYHILVVENDHDTGKILKKKLEKYYQVILTSKAKDALLIMQSQDVDLIISDVYMPEIDGYELCKTVKQNEKTKHIPVVLISSDKSQESKIKGFQAGADVFLQKPINIQELILRLDNILKSKGVMREYYSDFKIDEVDTEYLNNSDEIFLKNIVTYIYDNLDDPDLSVQQLSDSANLSRTQLYLNIKRLTGETPSSFLLDIKMKEAQKLLSSTNLTSSEISYKLGYKNPNHFSRQFKEYTGKSPTEFRT